MTTERTTCCVVGGGPAGMVLGLLLARAGVEVMVLEKHGDFLRDFRGDTVHPTTMDLLDDLGLGEKFAQLPQSRLEQTQLPFRGGLATFADFRTLPGRHKHIAMVPQWDLLDLLAAAANDEPAFTLRMNTAATGLVTSNGRVDGVTYRTSSDETGQILADLVVACDGRTSVLRAEANLPIRDYGSPMDVWWFRLPKSSNDPSGAVGVLSASRLAILLDRGSYWQAAAIIRKGADAEQRRAPVREMVRSIADLAPWLADRVDALKSWDEVKLLEVRVDRLHRWYRDGLLCIGDAAHAMSPIGGVGINLAVQDAVAAARLLAQPLAQGAVTTRDLARVSRRRLLPTIVVQGMQRLIQARILQPALDGRIEIAASDRLPLPLRLAQRVSWLQRIPAYLIGRGIMAERAPEFARRAPAR
jgi:2-polyprenyl-6-methoxyphenol hydroxylase-like FAD-dependent oxidoreductase